ncbi:MAG: TadE family protein, partial [Jatrophihabitans sp.]|uniref:TadE family protein n=1 Tax=Jatrophihabitans sp. TaxID=1932789 RepID=UPI003F7DFDA4
MPRRHPHAAAPAALAAADAQSRRPGRRRRQGRACGDRGFGALEAVIVIPVVVLTTMIVIQYVMLWHARHLAAAAAQNALREARSYHATAADGQQRGEEY